jgi:hypothetical protein
VGLGVLVLAVMAIAIVAAWINYAVASPRRKKKILATRATRSQAIMAKVPGTAYHAQHDDSTPATPSMVSEDDAYRASS